jgi:hypothetical protein
VTDTLEYLHQAYQKEPINKSLHCTGHWQVTVPLIVGGWKEGSMLKLTIEYRQPTEDPARWSCTGRNAEFASQHLQFPGEIFLESLPFDEEIEVAAEDGATGHLEFESSDPPEIKKREVWSIRIKALPPEGGGSPAASGGPGQSSPGFPGPSLPDY